jgi:hypothetical protein
MVDMTLPHWQQIQNIHDRVDWIFEAGFDFLSTGQ